MKTPRNREISAPESKLWNRNKKNYIKFSFPLSSARPGEVWAGLHRNNHTKCCLWTPSWSTDGRRMNIVLEPGLTPQVWRALSLSRCCDSSQCVSSNITTCHCCKTTNLSTFPILRWWGERWEVLDIEPVRWLDGLIFMIIILAGPLDRWTAGHLKFRVSGVIRFGWHRHH